jgi:NAD-dependent dihydropyrimidine dehydrogenase PreA subunit
VDAFQTYIKRKIVRIDEDKCDGCGLCIPSCAEGALQIIDGKARLVADKYCDSLGACLSECPRGAINIEEREAEPFDEEAAKQHAAAQEQRAAASPSYLVHWPVQLTLVPPKAPFLQGADVLLAADCTAFSYGGFHQNFLRGHALMVACPKLDNYEAHLAKLTEILRQSDIHSLTVLRMEVPCCAGLTRMAMQAILSSNKDIPFKETVISPRGEIKN